MVVDSEGVSCNATEASLLLLPDRPLRSMSVLLVLLFAAVASLFAVDGFALLPGEGLFLAMLACRAIAAAFVALAGLDVVLFEVPLPLTWLVRLLDVVMLPFDPRLRVWPVDMIAARGGQPSKQCHRIESAFVVFLSPSHYLMTC